jgi:drug/metabolite transporter (DMT)-like permease
MTQGILFALAAAFLYGVLGVMYELAAKRNYESLLFILWVQCWGTIIGLFLVLLRKVPLFSPRILEISLLGTSCYLMGLWSYLTASRERNIAANWTVLNLSVAVPITASVLWFHDTLTFSKVVGILFTLAAVVLVGEIGVKRIEYTRKWLRYILIALLLNGISITLFRFIPKALADLYILYLFGLSTLASSFTG